MAVLMNSHFDPIGKTYSAKIGETCKSMDGGGCMIYTFRILNFKKDSVVVSYRVKADCTSKEKEKGYENMYNDLTRTYKWTVNDKIIHIAGLDDYGALSIQDSKLIGKNKIEFMEESK